MSLQDNWSFVRRDAYGNYLYRRVAGRDNCWNLQQQLVAAGVTGWNAYDLWDDTCGVGKNLDLWASDCSIDRSLNAGDMLFTNKPFHTDENERFIVYNPLSSLPITTVYKSEKQANKVAEKMAEQHREPFFVAKILYGRVVNFEDETVEVTSDQCR